MGKEGCRNGGRTGTPGTGNLIGEEQRILIYEVLAAGKQNARSGKYLCDLLNLQPRDLTQAIEKERREGKAICASSSNKTPGYYIPSNQREMREYCKSLLHRAGEIHKTRQACLQLIDQLPAGPEE